MSEHYHWLFLQVFCEQHEVIKVINEFRCCHASTGSEMNSSWCCTVVFRVHTHLIRFEFSSSLILWNPLSITVDYVTTTTVWASTALPLVSIIWCGSTAITSSKFRAIVVGISVVFRLHTYLIPFDFSFLTYFTIPSFLFINCHLIQVFSIC